MSLSVGGSLDGTNFLETLEIEEERAIYALILGKIEGRVSLIAGDAERNYVLQKIREGVSGWLTPNSRELNTEYDLATDVFCGEFESLVKVMELNLAGVFSMYHSRFAMNDRVLRQTAGDILDVRECLRGQVSVALSNELHRLYELFKRPPRVTMVGDRELDTTKAVLDHERRYPNQLNFAGLVVPAAEVDERMHQLYPHMERLSDSGVVVPMLTDYEAKAAFDVHGVGENDRDYQDFEFHTPTMAASFVHVPYDPKRAKDEPDYRKKYCHELLARIMDTQPDVVMLANFKLILDESLPEALKGRLVNVHPSYLPMLKGWRSEHRAANLGEHPEYNGFTYHLVDPELDGGPTLFQQKVHVAPYDSLRASEIGEKAYLIEREETTRQRIIRAEAIFAPLVMSMVGSNLPRKIVNDQEAFEVEGRAGFASTEAYMKQLHEEFEEWKHGKNGNEDVSYEQWYSNVRVPYGRVMFEIEGEWKILEQIFEAEEFAGKEVIDPNREYIFYLRYEDFGGNRGAVGVLGELVTIAQGKVGDRGRLISSGVMELNHVNYGECLRCRFECVTDMANALEKRGIPFEVIDHSVRATAKRKPPIPKNS